MTFEEATRSIETLFVGVLVDISVSGHDADATPIAALSGVPRRVSLDDEAKERIHEAVGDVFGEAAAVFLTSDSPDNRISIWPHRFVSCRVREEPNREVEIVTRDAVIRISKHSRPWID